MSCPSVRKPAQNRNSSNEYYQATGLVYGCRSLCAALRAQGIAILYHIDSCMREAISDSSVLVWARRLTPNAGGSLHCYIGRRHGTVSIRAFFLLGVVLLCDHGRDPSQQ